MNFVEGFGEGEVKVSEEKLNSSLCKSGESAAITDTVEST